MEYYKELRKYVGHRPLILPGSVVLILNSKDEVLLQERELGVLRLTWWTNGAWGKLRRYRSS